MKTYVFTESTRVFVSLGDGLPYNRCFSSGETIWVVGKNRDLFDENIEYWSLNIGQDLTITPEILKNLKEEEALKL